MSAFLTYAYNQDGELVYVDDVPNGNECGCICPSCEKPLQARNRGEIREHHFAHQADTDCPYAYETMLHLLAKEKIRKAFYSQDEFNIRFEYQSFCAYKNDCHFVAIDDCMTSKEVKYNLNEYYDSCEQEIPFDKVRRRSDLKIWSSTHPDRKPVYIEFYVTGKAAMEKLHDGSKIIQIHIENESDVDDVVSSGLVEDKQKLDIYGLRDDTYIPRITFIGFKKEGYDNANINEVITFWRYILYRSGKSRCYHDTCLCTELKRSQRHALCEICFHTSVQFGVHELAKWIGFKRFGIQNCNMCKNYVASFIGMEQICRRYKYLGIDKSKKHDTARAITCPSFELNVEKMNESLAKCDICYITEL